MHFFIHLIDFYIFFQICFYLFQKAEREIFHLPFNSLVVYCSQVWGWQKPGAWNSLQFSHPSFRTQVFEPLLAAYAVVHIAKKL